MISNDSEFELVLFFIYFHIEIIQQFDQDQFFWKIHTGFSTWKFQGFKTLESPHLISSPTLVNHNNCVPGHSRFILYSGIRKRRCFYNFQGRFERFELIFRQFMQTWIFISLVITFGFTAIWIIFRIT